MDSQKRSILIKIRNYRTCSFIQSYTLHTIRYRIDLYSSLWQFWKPFHCFLCTIPTLPFKEAKQKNLDSRSISYIAQQINFFANLQKPAFLNECLRFEIQNIHLIQVLSLCKLGQVIWFPRDEAEISLKAQGFPKIQEVIKCMSCKEICIGTYLCVHGPTCQ